MRYAEGEAKEINSFIHDLAKLMKKHGVFMVVNESCETTNEHVVEFNALEDINDCESDSRWMIELVDMWPDEYCVVDSELGVVEYA